jgi:hypothetical protein
MEVDILYYHQMVVVLLLPLLSYNQEANNLPEELSPCTQEVVDTLGPPLHLQDPEVGSQKEGENHNTKEDLERMVELDLHELALLLGSSLISEKKVDVHLCPDPASHEQRKQCPG